MGKIFLIYLSFVITVTGTVILCATYSRVLLEYTIINSIIIAVLSLSFFTVSAVIFYKSFKIHAANDEKRNEFNRKKEWEQFCHILNADRSNYEREQTKDRTRYEREQKDLDRKRDTEQQTTIKAISDEVEKLKTEINELKNQKPADITIDILKRK
jgi:glucan phosphoethanolaminetransferase (alkaline phosphatase superfamily)